MTIRLLPLLFLFLLVLQGGVAPYSTAQEADSTQALDESWFNGLEYRMRGPYRGGRVTAVAGFPTKRPVLYMGSTGGGVWKSTNHGLSYRNISDGYFEVGSIGAIAVAPTDSNVVYVGTGSAGIRSNVSTGRGMYKSLDAGESWMKIGLPEAGQIGSIAVHPSDANTVFVAALGHPFGPNPQRGIFRSFDGGSTWERVLFVSDSTGAASVVINPNNPDEIYASMWRAERKPWTIISGGVQGGVYKSSDAGDSWTKLTNGLPTGVIGKIDLSISPANTDRLYALVEAPGDSSGLYRSDDAGASFSHINPQKNLTFRPFYYIHVHADPVNEDVVYVSNEQFFKSIDGGASFITIDTPHGDHHDLWIHPDDPDYLFQGNDGGATVSTDGGLSWSPITNQPTAEMYHVVVDHQHPYWLYGEQQDNTTIMIPSLPPVATSTIDPKQYWKVIAGCETGPIAIHPSLPHIVYGGCKGRFSRYNHKTGQEQQYWVYPHFNYGHAASDMPFRFQRTAPIEISPHDPSVIYHASQFVHKTINEGVNWQVISPDLTAFEPDKQGYSGEPITRDITGEEIYSAIYQLRESPVRQGVLWAGSNDGLVHISQDGGENWLHVTPESLPPGGRVQTIEPSPHAAGKAFIAVYRYMLDDWAPYLYKTNDFGSTWTLLTDSTSGFSMDHPTRVVREDPEQEGLLYAGTEFGMFISFNDGVTWQPFQLNLPATPITDIRVHRRDLVVSTMGRSFWILDDISPLHELDTPVFEADYHLFKPRDTYRYRWSAQRERFDPPGVPNYPPYGVFIDYYLSDIPEEQVLIEIIDNQGDVIRVFSGDTVEKSPSPSEEERMHGYFREATPEKRLPVQQGLNRFNWDLRYPGPTSTPATLSREEGPLVIPGTYTVNLHVGANTMSRTLDVRIDPRLREDNVTRADIEAQVLLSLRIRDRISELGANIQRIRSLRPKVSKVRDENGNESQVVNQTESILTQLDRIEQLLVQTQNGKVGAQLTPQLMRQFTYLYSMLDSADQPPGEDAYIRTEDLEMELNEQVLALKTLIDEEIAALNASLQGIGRNVVQVD